MIKIQADIKQDSVNNKGRLVDIKWTTDNDFVNGFLNLPRIYHHQFQSNVTINEVNAAFKLETVPLVQNAEAHITNSMTGTLFEVNI
jgi:hypothetical protein